jgi:hypothetical protein
MSRGRPTNPLGLCITSESEVLKLVYVISKEGKPLMPAERHGKVRILLKQKKAKVVIRKPFTIQLLYETTTYTQTDI